MDGYGRDRGVAHRRGRGQLANTDGRWQLSWRLRWTFACQHHRLLLLDSCPACAATPRIRISGVTPPLPPATCAHTITPRKLRCGTDLTTAETLVATDDILELQSWVESLIEHASQHHDSLRHAGKDAGAMSRKMRLSCLPISRRWCPGSYTATTTH